MVALMVLAAFALLMDFSIRETSVLDASRVEAS